MLTAIAKSGEIQRWLFTVNQRRFMDVNPIPRRSLSFLARDPPDLALLIDHAPARSPPRFGSDWAVALRTKQAFRLADVRVLPRLPVPGSDSGVTPRLKTYCVVALPFRRCAQRDSSELRLEAAARPGLRARSGAGFSVPFRWKNGGAVYEKRLLRFVELGCREVISKQVDWGAKPCNCFSWRASIDAGAAFSQDRQWVGPAATAEQVSEAAELARGRAAIKASGGITTLDSLLPWSKREPLGWDTSRGVAAEEALRRPPSTGSGSSIPSTSRQSGMGGVKSGRRLEGLCLQIRPSWRERSAYSTLLKRWRKGLKRLAGRRPRPRAAWRRCACHCCSCSAWGQRPADGFVSSRCCASLQPAGPKLETCGRPGPCRALPCSWCPWRWGCRGPRRLLISWVALEHGQEHQPQPRALAIAGAGQRSPAALAATACR